MASITLKVASAVRLCDPARPRGALLANRSDILKMFLSISTARRLAAGLRIFPQPPMQRFPLQLGLGQQPLEAGGLLAQFLEFLSSIGLHPAVGKPPVVQRRRRHTEIGGDLLTVLTAVDSSARRSLRTMSFAERRVRPTTCSSPLAARTSSHRTLELDRLSPGGKRLNVLAYIAGKPG
jgi:hypothetical protein